jgi:hypothetical protein
VSSSAVVLSVFASHWISSIFSHISSPSPPAQTPQTYDEINIFSLASGHLYERFMRFVVVVFTFANNTTFFQDNDCQCNEAYKSSGKVLAAQELSITTI